MQKNFFELNNVNFPEGADLETVMDYLNKVSEQDELVDSKRFGKRILPEKERNCKRMKATIFHKKGLLDKAMVAEAIEEIKRNGKTVAAAKKAPKSRSKAYYKRLDSKRSRYQGKKFCGDFTNDTSDATPYYIETTEERELKDVEFYGFEAPVETKDVVSNAFSHGFEAPVETKDDVSNTFFYKRPDEVEGLSNYLLEMLANAKASGAKIAVVTAQIDSPISYGVDAGFYSVGVFFLSDVHYSSNALKALERLLTEKADDDSDVGINVFTENDAPGQGLGGAWYAE